MQKDRLTFIQRIIASAALVTALTTAGTAAAQTNTQNPYGNTPHAPPPQQNNCKPGWLPAGNLCMPPYFNPATRQPGGAPFAPLTAPAADPVNTQQVDQQPQEPQAPLSDGSAPAGEAAAPDPSPGTDGMSPDTGTGTSSDAGAEDHGGAP